MKKIKLLITLSLTFLMLTFGSISVFAVDIDGDEYVHYVFCGDLTSLLDVIDASPFRVYCRYDDSSVDMIPVYYGVSDLNYYTVFYSNISFDTNGYISTIYLD